MLNRLFAPGVVLVALGLLFVTSVTAQFKSGTLTVPLYVTVTDKEGRLTPDLLEEDFEVYDNGKLQKLSFFENKTTPITAIVMIDTSGSMTLILDRVKAAAEQFLIRLLPEDQGRVGAFSDKIQFLPDDAFTSDRDQLIRLIEGTRFRLPDALVGRGRRKHRATRAGAWTQGDARVHGRRRYGQPPRSWRRDGSGHREGDHGLRHRPQHGDRRRQRTAELEPGSRASKNLRKKPAADSFC